MRFSLVGPIYPFRGGIAHYTTSLARAFSAQYPTQIISFRRQYPKWLYPGDSDQDPSQQPLTLEANYSLDSLNPFTWYQTARAIQRFQPNLTIVQWWTTFWAPAFGGLLHLLERARCPTLVLIHNVLPHEPRPWDAPLTRWAWQRSRFFVTQTPTEHARLAQLRPNAVAKLAPMPVFDMFADQQLPPAEAKARLGLAPELPVILFFGLVRPYKGLKYLVEAWALLKQRGVQFQGVVAGEFWEEQADYEAQLARLGLQDCVRLEGRYIPNEQVSWYFSAADVFAAPYVGGTQSAAVNMALSFGLPLVVTHAAWLPAEAHYPAACVPPANAEALADALQDLLTKPRLDPTLRATAGPSWQSLVDTIVSFASHT